MLKFYFNGSPNPNKVALFLEESGLAYELTGNGPSTRSTSAELHLRT